MMQIRNGLSKAGMAITLALLTSPALACERGAIDGRVSYVRDGDTIELGAMAIRLQGLAAPEGAEPGGDAATVAMRRLVEGRLVRCDLDGSRTHDRCATCYLEGRDIAAIMVEQGLARDCPRFSGGRYAVIEAQAVVEGATIRESYRLPGYCRER
jgi:micrococcal nuclease